MGRGTQRATSHFMIVTEKELTILVVYVFILLLPLEQKHQVP